MSFSILLNLNGPKRNYHINHTNSYILKGLKTLHHSKIIKTTSILQVACSQNHVHSQKQSILFQNFSILCTKLNQIKIHNIRHQTKFIKHLNERNSMDKAAAPKKASFKNLTFNI